MFELEQQVKPGDKKGSNGFIAQAGILAMAGIISRIIGFLYRSPLSGIIGDLGLGYYSEAYTFYTMVLLISSYSIPSAVSKVIAQKIAVEEYENAHRLFRAALMYVLVVGGIASLILYFGAGLFVEPSAIHVLQVFAPTIFVYGLVGVLRGYFQAHKTMVQTSVSQIIEQVINALVSIGGAYLLIHTFMGSMDMPLDREGQVQRAVYGAMGSAIGTGAGVAVALIFMLYVYMKNRTFLKQRIAADTGHKTESYKDIFKAILFIVTPFVLSTAIYNLSAPLNTKVYTDLYPRMRGIDPLVIGEHWGIFSGKALTLSNIPIAFASAMAAAMIPSVAQLISAGKKEVAAEKIGIAVKTTMLISIPSSVGLFALAGPVTVLLFPNAVNNYSMAQGTLMALSLSVIFYALSTLNSSILQGLGKVNVPIVNAAIALVIQTALVSGLLFLTNLDVYSVAIGNTVYAAAMAYLNQRGVRKAVGYKQEIQKTFLRPFFASAIMGVIAWGIYTLLHDFAHLSIRISVLPAIGCAIPVYFAALILVKGVDEEELRGMPKGHLLVKLFKKLHLM